MFRTVGVGAGVLALGLASGCGSTSSTPKPAAGGSSPSSSPSSTTSGAGTLTKANFGQTIAAAMKKAGSYHFTLTTGAAGASVTGSGDGRVNGPTPEARTIIKIPGGTLESVVTGGYFYIRSPMLHTAKPWLKIDPHAKSGMGALVGQLGGNSDPTKSLQVMSAASQVTKAGSANIDGVQTTEYAVTLPTKSLAKTLSYPAQVTKLLPATLVYHVWVGSDGLVRQVTSAIPVLGHSSTTKIKFSKFGESVQIVAPPASQTTSHMAGMPGM
ncbi:MAG: LppX_LprAFG lipoprotein [Actinomycetota bacterium]|nr:LppX_LprAFG lipoprotein [Actinomycetota bacterium]